MMLQDIGAAARATQTLRVEGVTILEVTGEGTLTRTETHFKSARQDALHSRVESTLANNSIAVCDGDAQWVYLGRAGFHTKNPISAERCNPPAPRWENLTDSLVSAAITGRDQSEFEGTKQPCEEVRAEYISAVPIVREFPAVSRVVRTMCIDRSRRIILREKFESVPDASRPNVPHYAMTITYSRVELNPSLSAELFHFEPPSGSWLNQTTTVGANGVGVGSGGAMPQPSLSPGVYRVGGGVSAPSLVSRV